MNALRLGMRLAILALPLLLATSPAAEEAQQASETEAPGTAGGELGAPQASKTAEVEQPPSEEDADPEQEGQDEQVKPDQGEADEPEPNNEPAEVFLPTEAISEDAAVPFPVDI